MAKNVHYLAIGEEANRGTAEKTTVGFIPITEPSVPNFEPDDQPKNEVVGEDSALGQTLVRRFSTKWNWDITTIFYTEAGAVAGMVGTNLKHFFGKVTSAQNATTGQYLHMMYPDVDPYSSANLDTKALTFNRNINESATVKNWPYTGTRVNTLGFEQSPGSPLLVPMGLFGQNRDASTTLIASPSFAPENLRCDYNNLIVYTGTITRVGTGPNFTDFTFGSATIIKPDKITLKLGSPATDKMRLSGVTYADKTRFQGLFNGTLEIIIDWEDPASGFSSVDEFNSWMAATGVTNFFLHWDTGTQAGSGDNHSLYLDLPICRRRGGSHDLNTENDPLITLTYDLEYDATTAKYLVGLLLKNTAAAV